MAGYSPISDILSFGKSKKYSDKIMSNIINIDLTEDKKGIRFTTQDGVSFTVFFPYTLHEHSNLDILERINVDENGKLTFDGKSIEGDIFIKDDYYNKAEIDNRITSIAKGMSWKENVPTKTDLENLENNSKGDARIVDEESNIYVFNGEYWDKVGSSINIPNATSENDGLLSKEYFIKINKLDDDFVKNTEYNTLKRDVIAEQTELLTEDKTIKGSINEILNSVNNNMSSIINVEKNINDLFLVKDEFNSIIEKESISFVNEFIDGNIDIQTGELIDNEENIKYVRNNSTIIIGKESVISLQYSKENDLFTDVIVFAYTNENYIGNAELNMTTDNIDKYYNILLPENTNNIKIVFKIADERIQSDYVTLANSIDIKLNKLYIKEYNIKRFDDLNTSIKDLKTVVKSKNLFYGEFELGNLLVATGLPSPSDRRIRIKNFIPIDEDIKNLTIQRIDEEKVILKTTVFAYDSEQNFIKVLTFKNFNIANKTCLTVALTPDIKFIKVAFLVSDEKVEDKHFEFIKNMNFQIEAGLEATEYEPHKLFVKKERIEGFNDLEEKVNELFTSVSNGKNLLETAITDKGGVVSKNSDIATFEELKNGIGNIKTGINIFSQIDKPTSNNGIWIKNNKMYENIDFFDSSEDTTFENEKMTDLSFYFYITNRTLTIKKEIYILTKYTDSNDNIKSLIYKYNTENNVYEVVSSISDSTSCYFYESCAISVGNYIYLFNLKSIQNPSDCSSYKYNIETNTYTGINNSISISNGSFAIAINNNEIYIFSGTKIYLYNISTNSYETLENCPYDCRYGAGILINNDIYIFGGVSNYAAYKYDIINKQFTKLKDIPSRFSRNNIIKIDNYIYLFGCSTDYKELDGELNAYEENKKSYRYDINSDTYERISDVPYDILAKRVELVGNDIYILGSNTTTNKRYNIKLTKKELKPNSILFMNTQIIPRYNVKLYNNIDYEKMNNFSFYKMITTNENAEIETVEKYIYNDSKWIKI